MGQYFKLISIDRREHARLGKLSEAMGGGETDCLPYMIAKPSVQHQPTKPDHQSTCSQHQPTKSDHRSRSTCSPVNLSNLPAGLLVVLFEHIDLASIFSLSLASKRLWKIGWPYIRNALTCSLAPWRGTRLICEGDYNAPGDLPPGILSSEELDVLTNGLGEDGLELLKDNLGNDDFGSDEERFLHGPINLFVLMDARGKKVSVDLDIHYELLEHYRMASQCLSKSEGDEVYNYIFDQNLFSESQNWTLRNLSAKKFVQGSKLNAAFHPKKSSTGLLLPYPGFGEAILSQISWSADDISSLDLNRGEWAGHRLEIIPHEEHLADADPSWEDESEKVIQILARAIGLEAFPIKTINDDKTSAKKDE